MTRHVPSRRFVAVMLGLLAIASGCATSPRAGSEHGGTATGGEEWYCFDWMSEAEYAPVFNVLDTESSLGPYADKTKTITLNDLVKMHGHPCDGLISAACALSLALQTLYPEATIDRTDTGCITNNSPCFGDVAAYLTGGRIRFGTQKINPEMKSEFIVYRFSTKEAVKVTLKPGVFPDDVAALERKIRAGDFSQEELRRCQQLQWDFARNLMRHPLTESFLVERMPPFEWIPDTYEHLGPRGDIVNKNAGR